MLQNKHIKLAVPICFILRRIKNLDEQLRKDAPQAYIDELDRFNDLVRTNKQLLNRAYEALQEGTKVPIGVPVLTIVNTKPEFFWLTNFLETLISNLLWKPMTSATIAYNYRKNLQEWAEKTDKDNVGFVDFQGHDLHFPL